MGWKSTMCITPTDARKEILNKMIEASDLELGRMLDALFVESFYNFHVIPAYDSEDDLQYQSFKLRGGTLWSSATG